MIRSMLGGMFGGFLGGIGVGFISFVQLGRQEVPVLTQIRGSVLGIYTIPVTAAVCGIVAMFVAGAISHVGSRTRAASRRTGAISRKFWPLPLVFVVLGAGLGVAIIESGTRTYSADSHQPTLDILEEIQGTDGSWSFTAFVYSRLGSIRKVAAGVVGGVLGLWMSVLVVYYFLDVRAGTSILFWNSWAVLSGLCLAGGADIALAYVFGTYPPGDFELDNWIVAFIAAGFIGMFAMSSILLWCLLTAHFGLVRVSRAVVVSCASCLCVFSFLVLECSSRALWYFGNHFTRLGSQVPPVANVLGYFEGKVDQYSLIGAGRNPDPVYAVLAVTAAIGSGVFFALLTGGGDQEKRKPGLDTGSDLSRAPGPRRMAWPRGQEPG